MLEWKFLLNYLQLWWSYAILSATTQRAFRLMVDILSTLWWLRLIWHNFVKVAGNWIKIYCPVYIGTCNRHVKFGKKIPNRLGKNVRKLQGGIFLSHTVELNIAEVQSTTNEPLLLLTATESNYILSYTKTTASNQWNVHYYKRLVSVDVLQEHRERVSMCNPVRFLHGLYLVYCWQHPTGKFPNYLLHGIL